MALPGLPNYTPPAINNQQGLANREVNYQAAVWQMEARQPSNIVLVSDFIDDITTDWKLLYQCAELTFVEIQEIILYNGTAGTVKTRIAVVNPTQTVPTGSSANQPYIYHARSLASETSDIASVNIGMGPGWKIYGWTDAAAGDYLNVMVNGIVIGQLS